LEKVSGAQAKTSLLALLYGQAKLKKTTTALAVPPEMRPVAYLDADKGARIRAKILGMTPEQRVAVGVVEPIHPSFGPWIHENISFFYPGANYYEDCWEFANVTLKKEGFKTVIMDSASRMGDAFLKQVAQTEYKGSEGKRVKLGMGPSATVHPMLGDFGFAQDRVMDIIKGLDESPAHVLLVTHEKTAEIKEGEINKRVLGGPRTIGNALLEVIPSIVDIALRVEGKNAPMRDAKGNMTGGMKREVVMRTRNHEYFLAGDRSGLFVDGEVLDEFVFWKKLMGLIELGAEEVKA